MKQLQVPSRPPRDAGALDRRFFGPVLVLCIVGLSALMALLAAWAVAVAVRGEDPTAVVNDGFWARSDQLPALAAAVIAAAIGAVGATLGTWFVARRVGREIQANADQDAWTRWQFELDRQEDLQVRMLVSKVLEERGVGLLHIAGQLHEHVIRWNEADADPVLDELQAAAEQQMNAMRLLSSASDFIPEGDLRSALFDRKADLATLGTLLANIGVGSNTYEGGNIARVSAAHGFCKACGEELQLQSVLVVQGGDLTKVESSAMKLLRQSA